MPMNRGAIVALGAVGALALAVVAGISWIGGRGVGPLLPPREQCEATVAGATVVLELEQAESAAIIAGVAVRRGLPARAVTIALATAYQESGLRNLAHGDRDSLGLFQQRPSQGWGTEAQVRDPHYAAGKFYDALVKVRNYQTLAVTVAADRVQRSAFPNAYADHEADARILASALTGQSKGALSCTVNPASAPAEVIGKNGLTPRAEAVRKDLAATFGKLSTGGYRPGGLSTGHMEGSAHYEGRAIDVFVKPITAANTTRGWALAQYLVARAYHLGIKTIIFSDRIWTAGGRSDSGWRDYQAPDRPGNTDTLRHLDHVHVDVVEQ
ncbi:heavy metal transporter [Kribbella sancticallisti]|uniref:Heavy metal transporter n=1 Tax=Kribbella sancticallisti TaxID=460087 RepID=A0ABP4QM40_9ACTN